MPAPSLARDALGWPPPRSALLPHSLSLSLSWNQSQKIFVGTTKASVPTQLTQRSCQQPSDLRPRGL